MNIAPKKETIILKIGGSVITHKHRTGVFIRHKLLIRIAREIHSVLIEHPNIQLLLIHGAGAGGHQLAKQYQLSSGTGNDARKWHGSFLIHQANQRLNLAIAEIFVAENIRLVPVHTASVIIQTHGNITSFDQSILNETLRANCLPILYGEMVFDTTLGMSICSGDAIATFLADIYHATRILYASDVDGIFDKDPHLHTDARHIPHISISTLLADTTISLSGSHHIDVTGGIRNKITAIYGNPIPKSLQEIVIFNGLKSETFRHVLSGKPTGTSITIK